MIDITKPLRFRSEDLDREVRYLAEMPDGRLTFAVQDTSGGWYTVFRYKGGRAESGRDGSLDIINVPETRIYETLMEDET